MNMPKRLARQLAMAASVGGVAALGALGSTPSDGVTSDASSDNATADDLIVVFMV
jgi:hypothetical protein